MEELHDAIMLLKATIERQNELQEEANGILRGMNEGLAANSQELLELRRALAKRDNGDGPIDVEAMLG